MRIYHIFNAKSQQAAKCFVTQYMKPQQNDKMEGSNFEQPNNNNNNNNYNYLIFSYFKFSALFFRAHHGDSSSFVSFSFHSIQTD